MKAVYAVKYVGASAPRPVITQGNVELTAEQVAYRLNELQQALADMKAIVLHEIENCRTPETLPVENGGKGLGHFEGILDV